MPRQRRAAQNRAVEERTRQRLTARREAAQRGAETRRRNRERAAPSAPEPEVAPQVAEERTEATAPNVAQQGRASGAMVTVALRGEQAQRLRALAAAQEVTLAKLLERMMDRFETQAE